MHSTQITTWIESYRILFGMIPDGSPYVVPLGKAFKIKAKDTFAKVLTAMVIYVVVQSSVID